MDICAEWGRNDFLFPVRGKTYRYRISDFHSVRFYQAVIGQNMHSCLFRFLQGFSEFPMSLPVWLKPVNSLHPVSYTHLRRDAAKSPPRNSRRGIIEIKNTAPSGEIYCERLWENHCTSASIKPPISNILSKSQ